jgi:hypothetical protein
MQTKKAPTAAERQGEIPRSRTAEELALRDEVLRLRQRLEGLASKSNADTLKSVCLVLPSGCRPGPTNNRWITAEGLGPPGGSVKMWSDARGDRAGNSPSLNVPRARFLSNGLRR